MPEPRCPAWMGSRSTRRAGPKTSRSLTTRFDVGRFTYIMRPTKAGQFTIGPAEAPSLARRTRPTRSPRCRAGSAANANAGSPFTHGAGRSTASRSPSASMDSQTLFARTQTDKSEAFLGEQVTLSFQFYQGRTFWGGPELFAAGDSRVLVRRPAARSEILPAGWAKAISGAGARTALFPTALGEQTIGPARLEVRDFFNRFPLQSDPITLKVSRYRRKQAGGVRRGGWPLWKCSHRGQERNGCQ